jgi:hypothetical protein
VPFTKTRTPPGPQLRLDLGGRDEARYSPPNPAFKTWNNCPPNFTVRDGLCKPRNALSDSDHVPVPAEG